MSHWHNNSEFILMQKLGKPCMDCKQLLNPWQMDFDHRNAKTKLNSVSQMKDKSKTLILAEIAKCDLICSNCHRNRTWRRLNFGSL